jgi:hypothetical protein
VSIEAIARVIQLAIAPVFLLAGIVGLITLLSTRLGRIIDRARLVSAGVPQAQSDVQRKLQQLEAAALWTRVRLVNWAMRLCVGSALLICLVVVVLFVGDLVSFDFSLVVAGLFIAAMVLMVAGLLCLLRETGISAQLIRQAMALSQQRRDDERRA